MRIPIRLFVPGQAPLVVTLDTAQLESLEALQRALAAAAGYTADGCMVVHATDGRPLQSDDILAGADLALVTGDERTLGPAPRAQLEIHQAPRVPLYTPPGCALAAPPERPTRARLALAGAVVPVIGGIAMFAMTRHPLALSMAVLGPLALLLQWLGDRRRGVKAWGPARQAFYAALDTAVAQCREQVVRWEASYGERYPAPDALLPHVSATPPQCWDRRRSDSDVGVVRIGAPERTAQLPFTIATGGAVELRHRAEQALGDAGAAPTIPMTIATNGAAIGIIGDARHQVATWMTCALAAAHSPRDLRIAIAAPNDHRDQWGFAAWLPHTAAHSVMPELEHSLVARGPQRTDALLRALAGLARSRATARASSQRALATDDAPLAAVCIATEGCDRALVAEIAERGAPHNITVVALAASRDQLPHACSTIIDTDRNTIAFPDGTATRVSVFDALDDSTRDRVVRALARLRDVSTSDDDAHLPDTVRLSDCIGPITADHLAGRWAQPQRPLTAAIGVSTAGVCTIDLRANGPHALVAGTTGSGKSALLQTLVAALAAEHAPERLQFLLIDYKGGAAFGPCVGLPHVTGMVTDLDDGLARRVLIALDAELKAREVLLRDLGAPDLATLERVAAHDDRVPANLCIVIDEFAALVHEIPDFIDGIVDLAQRGRSLGIHVVLATQHPGGVVNDRIRANTALRIALRTTTAHDSTDIIGTDAAVHLPRQTPGRAVIAFSAHEHATVQSAWAGSPATTPATGAIVATLDTGTDMATRVPGAALLDASIADGASSVTELETLVRVATIVHEGRGGRPVRAPWPDPLPECLPLTALERNADPSILTIGLRDEPERQAQPPLTISLESLDALLVTGGPGASTTLATVALAAASQHGADALNVHIIDDGTGVLRPLAMLVHTGAIVSLHDQDATTQFLEWLAQTIAVRREQLVAAGVSYWETLRAHSPDAPPRLLILIDGLHALLHTFERVDTGKWVDLLVRLVADGRACGIHWCMTSDRLTGLPPALRAHISEHIALGRPEDDEYRSDRTRKTRPHAPVRPGRGRIGSCEVQIATPGCTPTELATTMVSIANNTRTPGVAVAVPYQFPAVITVPDHAPQCSTDIATWTPIIGVTDRGAPAVIDLRHDSLLICGARNSGRSSLLEHLAQSVPVEQVLLLDARATHPEFLEAQLRTCTIAARETPEAARLILIDNADLIVDGPAGTALGELLSAAQRSAVRVVAVTDPFAVSRAYGGWMGELRRTRRAVLLAPIPANDGEPFGVRLKARPGQPFPPGRGYLIEAGTATVIHCVTPA